MPTVSALAARYPEIADLDPSFLVAVINEAQAGIDPTIYGTRNDAAVMAMAAHLVWVSPAGISLRTETDKNNEDSSGYMARFRQIRREVTVGFMVL